MESEVVVKVAEPALRLLVASGVAPSLKVTVPVGVPLPGAEALTVAVKVTLPVGVPLPGATALIVAVKTTDWPKTDGLTEEARAVALLAWPTVWVITAEVFVLKLPSPL